ncbi:MAG TPA: PEGA domain-containing protein [Polyangiales bacterium]|nr:PEGA domain-containing protein [Polyangiales bacterium]
MSPAPALARGKKAAKTSKTAAPAGPTPEAKEKARAAYGRGQAAFAAGNYQESKNAFQEAFGAVPNPIVLLSIAESQAKLGELSDSVTTLQKYLELRSDAPDRADIEAKIKSLNATPAQVAVTTDPPGAVLDLDGMPTHKKSPATIEMSPGEHSIDYTLRGYDPGTAKLTVQPGEKQGLHLPLTKAEKPPPVTYAPVAAAPVPKAEAEPTPSEAPVTAEELEGPQEPAANSGRPTTALWITGGIGVAGLITGSVFGMLAVKEHSNFNDHPTEASANKGERLALFADVGFGVGVMAIATCAVLYLTSDDAPSATASDKAEAKLRVSPALSPSVVGANARLSF